MKEFIGVCDVPYILCACVKILADNQESAEKKFLEYLDSTVEYHFNGFDISVFESEKLPII